MGAGVMVVVMVVVMGGDCGGDVELLAHCLTAAFFAGFPLLLAKGAFESATLLALFDPRVQPTFNSSRLDDYCANTDDCLSGVLNGCKG